MAKGTEEHAAESIAVDLIETGDPGEECFIGGGGRLRVQMDAAVWHGLGSPKRITVTLGAA